MEHDKKCCCWFCVMNTEKEVPQWKIEEFSRVNNEWDEYCLEKEREEEKE